MRLNWLNGLRVPVRIDLSHDPSDMDHLIMLLSDLSPKLWHGGKHAFRFSDLALDHENLAAEAGVSLCERVCEVRN